MIPRIAILISGRGSNMKALLKRIDSGDLKANCVLVFSDRKDAAGLAYARERGINVASFSVKECGSREDYEKKLLELLRQHNVDFIVCAGYLKIIGSIILEAYPMRIINIHPSLLPAFAGLKAQRQALDYGVRFSGCTVHFVDASVDSGPIIAQAVTEVASDDTEESLSLKILRLEHDLYWKALKKVFRGFRLEGRRVIFTDNQTSSPTH